MKKIGEGWQYSVYDLNNGRVLKRFHSWPKCAWVIFKTIFPFKDDSLWEVPGFVRSSKDKADVSFDIIKRKRIPPEWLGNPKFINRYDYEQDMVIPLHDVFDNSDALKTKFLVDHFVDFNKKLLALGIIDKSFNITKNFGLTEKGKIILIDIGELFDDPKKIESQRRNRAWAKNYVAGCIKDERNKQYFIQEMDKAFGL